jgi:hypothetical protein
VLNIESDDAVEDAAKVDCVGVAGTLVVFSATDSSCLTVRVLVEDALKRESNNRGFVV